MILFFDAGLLAIGNVLFLAGIPFIIGFQRAVSFFNPFSPKRKKARGIICFFLGVLMVLWRWAVLGLLVEFIGMVELFGPMLPMVVGALRNLPIIGPVLSAPGIDRVVDFLSGAVRNKRPKSEV
jgi:hypothetical protein